jgi:hypothetical protein
MISSFVGSVSKSLAIALIILIVSGCGPSKFQELEVGLGKFGSEISDTVGIIKPRYWMITSGKKVDIGDEIVSILGTDQCNTGFGNSYSCWMFSLEPSTETPVVLSNGLQELWRTVDEGEGVISLSRPNGFKVVAL